VSGWQELPNPRAERRGSPPLRRTGAVPPAPAFESPNGRADVLYVVNDALVGP